MKTHERNAGKIPVKIEILAFLLGLLVLTGYGFLYMRLNAERTSLNPHFHSHPVGSQEDEKQILEALVPLTHDLRQLQNELERESDEM